MDPLAAAATITSIFAFSTSSLLLIQNYVNSTENLRKIETEVRIIQHILEECHSVLSEINLLPPSVQISVELCFSRQYELLKLLDLLVRPKKQRWLRNMMVAVKQNELLVLYQSFRDSVILLRDLSST